VWGYFVPWFWVVSSFRLLPYPPGYFWDFLASETKISLPCWFRLRSSIYSPCSFERSVSTNISLLTILEGSSRTFASRLTIASWLEGIPIMVTSYLLYAPLHTIDSESPGGGVADYLWHCTIARKSRYCPPLDNKTTVIRDYIPYWCHVSGISPLLLHQTNRTFVNDITTSGILSEK
jgi:hypothetical protein